MAIRVALVDDQELIREGLAIILGAQPDIDIPTFLRKQLD